MKNKLSYILGLTIGIALSFGTIALAQAVKILPDPNLCICYDMPAPTLAEANAMKLEVDIDRNRIQTAAHTCVASPINTTTFACQFPLPTQYQTVGQHTVEFRLGNLEADDTISWGTINTIIYEVTSKRGAPGVPFNIKIIKKS